MAVVVGFILIALYLPMFSLQLGCRRGIEFDGDSGQQSDTYWRPDDAGRARDRRSVWRSGTAVRSSICANSASIPELFRSIPAELMFRYNFVPLESQDTTLVVAMADPSQLQLTDELVPAAGQAPANQGRHRLADRRPAEAHRAISARAGPGDRGLHAAGSRRRRGHRRKYLHGEAHAAKPA